MDIASPLAHEIVQALLVDPESPPSLDEAEQIVANVLSLAGVFDDDYYPSEGTYETDEDEEETLSTTETESETDSSESEEDVYSLINSNDSRLLAQDLAQLGLYADIASARVRR